MSVRTVQTVPAACSKLSLQVADLPTSDLFIEIFSIESRFHLTVGVGLPIARHRSDTFEPSRTITSLELNESSMFGGTAVGERARPWICSGHGKAWMTAR